MNRKERRAKGIKNNDPVLTVKKSDFKAYFDNYLYNDPSVQKAIEEEVRRKELEEAKKQDMDILTLFLMSVRRSEKHYGRKRLLRLAHNLSELQKYYEGRYEESDLFAMRKHLKEEVGIDVERINDEIERFLNENPDER